MKKKRAAVAALVASIALSATFSGCSLVSVNNRADMEQVIATVDISKSDKFGESGLANYAAAISTESVVVKRSLISYFLNYGYSYVQNGSSYADTFNMLVDALVDNAVLTQYATMALLQDMAENSDNEHYDKNALEKFIAFEDDIARYEYLLGGEDSDYVKLAKYSLYSSINSALDSYEETIIEGDNSYQGTATRTTPTNLNTEQDDYYPKTEDGELDYYVYTGYTGYLLSDSGAYSDDALEGTTKSTRRKAYNSFINVLRNNFLVDKTDGETLTDILELDYIKDEYVNQLQQSVVNKYYEDYEDKQAAELKSNSYDYINNVYNEILNSQKESYASSSSFETAMSSMSSSSFILYSPSTDDSDKFDGVNTGTFGFVYNILLPFNAKQSVKLSEIQTLYQTETDNITAYYNARNAIMKEITTEDQRGAWFNGATDYSFKAADGGVTDYYGADDGREYLFFENNLTDSEEGGRYKKLLAYDGRYSYNGKVYENEDGSYTLIGNKLDIDGMLSEFSAYIDYVLGDGSVTFDGGYTPSIGNSAFFDEKTDFYKEGSDDEIDYSNFLYASGTVDFGTFNRSDLMNAETDQYKAMSAVNELQYAYTTDTGVLSQYVGYSVSAYDTSYIKEFEYAAKYAVNKGEGAFAVCAGDYGWHLIYVTYTFAPDSAQYTPDWENNIDKEGTFENLFFEWIKSNDLSDVTTTRRSKIISDFNKDTTVVKYQSRYQDLLDLDS